MSYDGKMRFDTIVVESESDVMPQAERVSHMCLAAILNNEIYTQRTALHLDICASVVVEISRSVLVTNSGAV